VTQSFGRKRVKDVNRAGLVDSINPAMTRILVVRYQPRKFVRQEQVSRHRLQNVMSLCVYEAL